jgi:hypothetical protein
MPSNVLINISLLIQMEVIIGQFACALKSNQVQITS